MKQPNLYTPRLILRPFSLEDGQRVQLLAGNSKVASTTATIPHPYPDGAAEAWISGHEKAFLDGTGVHFAITSKEDFQLIGCIALGISQKHGRAEIGYWIGVDYWNQGYCSEATKRVVHFGFTELKLRKITSRHLAVNPASGKVMRKAHLLKEGHLRQEMLKDGNYHDIEIYGILEEEFCKLQSENWERGEAR